MKPTLEEMRSGSTVWSRTYRNVRYNLSHHGISEYSPEGTWCYYIFLTPDIFQNPQHFILFDKEPEIKEGFGGSDKLWLTYDYYDIPDLNFHGGVTWYSKEPYFDRVSGKQCYAIKIGCDYGHSWDRDSGYWQGMNDVDRDAKRSIDILADAYPIMERCAYSGKLDMPENFYVAKHGGMVHNSLAGTFDEGWHAWEPAE